MEKTPWQRRARAAGLTQKKIAALTWRDEFTVSRALRGQFAADAMGPYAAVIIAWELMNEEQRKAWLNATASVRANGGEA